MPTKIAMALVCPRNASTTLAAIDARATMVMQITKSRLPVSTMSERALNGAHVLADGVAFGFKSRICRYRCLHYRDRMERLDPNRQVFQGGNCLADVGKECPNVDR